MSYARNLLSRNEEVVYESRQHWFAVIARTWVWILVAIVALALALWVGTNRGQVLDNPTIDGAVTVIAVAALLGAIGWIGFVLWDWRNQEWLITTRRVMRAEGVLNKSVSDTSLEKINDARLDQSVFGRIFEQVKGRPVYLLRQCPGDRQQQHDDADTEATPLAMNQESY